jgi:PadR family transcriptional regulator, regulatory protein AphA
MIKADAWQAGSGQVRTVGSPSSYLVLGMVSLLGKPTTYEINRQVGYTVGQFWSFPASQLYAEIARLAAAGLLDEQREQGGRHRRYYTITDQGRQVLGDWLGEPTSPGPSWPAGWPPHA